MLALVAGLVLVVSVAAPAAADRDRIEFIGEETFPTGYLFDGVEVGGLSGITWDSGAGVYYTLSDDRSQIAPARFYTMTIDVSDGSLDAGDVTFLDQTTLLAGDGSCRIRLGRCDRGSAVHLHPRRGAYAR